MNWQHLSGDNYLEQKKQYYQNCYVQYCVLQLCTMRSTHIRAVFTVDWWFRFRCCWKLRINEAWIRCYQTNKSTSYCLCFDAVGWASGKASRFYMAKWSYFITDRHKRIILNEPYKAHRTVVKYELAALDDQSWYNNNNNTCFMAHCLGLPGWAIARMVKPSWIFWSKTNVLQKEDNNWWRNVWSMKWRVQTKR